jgi:hypothetical protein
MGLGAIGGALFAAAGAIDGARRGRKDARIAGQRFNKAMDTYDQASTAFEQSLARAEPFMQRMLETAESGLAEQRAIVNDVGEFGFTQIADALTRGTGSLTRGFGGRGFAGSSMHGNATRALGSDIARGYADLTSQIAGVRSQTVRAALNDLMTAQNQAAGFHANAGSTRASLLSQKAGGMLSVGHQPAQGVAAGYGQVGAFLGQALDDWMAPSAATSAAGGVDVGVAPGQMGPGLEHRNA